jgi:hypothetical protein
MFDLQCSVFHQAANPETLNPALGTEHEHELRTEHAEV